MKKNLNFYYRCLCLCALGLLGSLSPLLGQTIFKATPIDVTNNSILLLNNRKVFSEITCYRDEYKITVDCYLAFENGKQNPRTRLLIDDL